MSTVKTKDWNRHVLHAEVVARAPGFQHLRDRIIDLAQPDESDTVADIGAGTGLLTLALAPQVERIWAIDIAPAMCDYLRTKCESAELENVSVAVASADNLPLVDGCVDLVVSNYCLHHLDDSGKRAALAEAHRVLRPSGRLVFGDMMFGVSVTDARDREVLRQKVGSMLRKGPAGVARLARNGARIAARRWESPARAAWWRQAMLETGFVDVDVEVLSHEGGVAIGRRP